MQTNVLLLIHSKVACLGLIARFKYLGISILNKCILNTLTILRGRPVIILSLMLLNACSQCFFSLALTIGIDSRTSSGILRHDHSWFIHWIAIQLLQGLLCDLQNMCTYSFVILKQNLHLQLYNFTSLSLS